MKAIAKRQEMWADAVTLVAGLAAGMMAAPALMRMGLTLSGAFSALIVVLLAVYVIEEARV